MVNQLFIMANSIHNSGDELVTESTRNQRKVYHVAVE